MSRLFMIAGLFIVGLIIVLTVGLILRAFSRKSKGGDLNGQEPPADPYVCNVCDDRDCICRPETGEPKDR